MRTIVTRMLLSTVLSFVLIASCVAANSLLLWPIYPTITADKKATSVWIENKGRDDAYLQVRIFRWEQHNGQDTYTVQNQVIATPPFVQIPGGQKQLVRVLVQANIPAGQESAYRIIIDELPPVQPPTQVEETMAMAVKIRMRYSLPLFIYGNGLAAKPTMNADEDHWKDLQAQFVTENKKVFIRITNRGLRTVRLVDVQLETPGLQTKPLMPGLAGYIMPGQFKQWPVSRPISAKPSISASIEGKRYAIALL